MDSQDGGHLFMIGWMDIFVDRISSQFHLKSLETICQTQLEHVLSTCGVAKKRKPLLCGMSPD